MLGNLEKLTITAYAKRNRAAAERIGEFVAMFNPESWSQRYTIDYGKNQGYNSSGKPANYLRTKPSDLRLKLILDGTGVGDPDDPAPANASGQTVAKRIDELLNLCYRVKGKIHEPTYLVVHWGDLRYSCRFASLDINYTGFDRAGRALHAELDLTFLGDQAVARRMKKDNKQSPDLTQVRTVVAGDTLPLLAKSVYGSSEHYLRVAAANELDDFRTLTPGQRLVFPPIV